MASSSSRQTYPGISSSAGGSKSPQPGQSKLPKFLQKGRDRSRSVNTTSPTASSNSAATPSPSGSFVASNLSASTSSSGTATTTGSGRGDTGRNEGEGQGSSRKSNAINMPVIVEPPTARPRPRLDSTTPSLTSSANHGSSYTATSSGFSHSSSPNSSRLGERLSGWFSHFSASSTDLSLPSLLSTSSISHTPGRSSKGDGGRSKMALLAAARHGKGHLDKAVRYLMDSDATPDKCVEDIWLMGVRHQGWEEPSTLTSKKAHFTSTVSKAKGFFSFF